MKSTAFLLDKYNNPVPRYTSYPPANYFTDSFNQQNYIDALIESNQGYPRNISIYIHIPFCKRMCHYCGCNSCPMHKGDIVSQYIKALKAELKLVSQYIDKDRKLSQIHYGGGTPNAIDAGYLQEINSIIFSEFQQIEKAEIAIECNPAYLDQKYASALTEAGFNRFSLGIQDMDPKILHTVNREVPDRPFSETMAYLRENNPNAVINLDFIYGLPGQTVDSFLKTMEAAIELKPERLVTFSYAHVPWVNKAQAILEKAGLPDPIEKTDMYFTSHNLLKESGYKPLGLDHYVLEKDDLYKAFENHKLHRNFQGYCTRETTGQVYAFGASSISQLEKHYAQNIKTNEDYIRAIANNQLPIVKGYTLSPNEMIVREVINELMCNKKLHFATLAESLNIGKDELKNNIIIDREMLDSFTDDGIIEWNEEGITVTEQGVLFIRNVAASLDPALKIRTNNFSKSV